MINYIIITACIVIWLLLAYRNLQLNFPNEYHMYQPRFGIDHIIWWALCLTSFGMVLIICAFYAITYYITLAFKKSKTHE